jgi:hypothetical protein
LSVSFNSAYDLIQRNVQVAPPLAMDVSGRAAARLFFRLIGPV